MTTDLMASRCTAMSKQTGERCRQRPIPGGTVCRFHGGKAPQTVAAAEQRRAAAAAESELRDLWPGLAAAVAITDPIDLLARTAGVLEQMADVVGERVNELHGKVGGGQHLTQLRAEVVLLDRLLDKLLKASDAMARLGIAERQVELAQGQSELVVAAVRVGLGAVPELLPDQRSRFLAGFLGALGQAPAVVAGELAPPREAAASTDAGEARDE